jgi:cell division protein FtsQ
MIGRDGAVFSAPGAESIQGLPHLAGPDSALDEVIDFYNRSTRLFSGTGLGVTGVTLSERGGWTLVLASGAEVEIGRERTRERLQRFIDVLPRLMAGHSGFERADLRYANGFALRWQEAAPAAAPRTEKETRT